MRFVIRWRAVGPAFGSYFRRMSSIGPEFTASLAEAQLFDSMDVAFAAAGSHHGFTCSEVEQLDEAAHALAMDAHNAPVVKLQYLGVLGLLAECSLHLLRETSASDELRGLIEEALVDAQKVIPNLRWRRVLDRFEIETAPPPSGEGAA